MEALLRGMPIILMAYCLTLVLIGYVVSVLKLIDGKHKKLGWLMGIAGIICGTLVLSYFVGLLLND
ncbi:MAG: hypothetical protein KAX49_11815 [Halanaerobiales bacterium]|nr:hypothetical protein [Halanaerobiales bacterium]